MASLTPLEDIDEKFLQCPLCLDQLKEPKLLPCLHRYCKDCLDKIVGIRDTKIRCPTCREEHCLPPERINGYKTDFHTKSIIEYIQLQNSLEKELIQSCANCTEQLKMTAYCFKCRNFLCHPCEKHHMTSMIVVDHRPHILSLSSAEAKHLTIDKLMSLKAAPRCHTHPEKLSELCCSTCENLPICVACTYGEHRGHDLKEVSSLAKIEKEKLKTKFDTLIQHKGRINEMQEKISSAKKKLTLEGDQKKSDLQDEFNSQTKKTSAEIAAKDETLKQQMTKMKEELDRKICLKKNELEEEVKKAQDNYNRFCAEERKIFDAESNKLLEKNKEDKKILNEELKILSDGINELLVSLDTQVKEKGREIEEQQNHSDGILKRFENLTATSSRIMAAKHDWTYVQCVPGTCEAIDRFIDAVENQFSEDKLPSLTSKSLSSFFTDKVHVNISEEKECSINIANMRNRSLCIDDISSSTDGKIAITGRVSNRYTHITVINIEGEVLRQDVIRSMDVRNHWRCCEFLSNSIIATICAPKEIGLYSVSDGSYTRSNISVAIGVRLPYEFVSCIAVDHHSNLIIVGCKETKDLFVFDAQLQFLRTMALPSYVHWPREITVHERNLIVCDHEGRHAYVFTMDESKCTLAHEIPTPADGLSWRSTCVCTDRHGFIYMLHRARVYNRWVAKLAQYTQDGSQMLVTKSLNNDAENIRTADTNKGEKLVVSEFQKRELDVYSLMTELGH